MGIEVPPYGRETFPGIRVGIGVRVSLQRHSWGAGERLGWPTMKIHHPVLDVTEDVNSGLAGVLIEGSGWEPVDEADYQKKAEAENVEEEEPKTKSRSEALKKPRKPRTAKKETD
jgi:hypothetical protein